jgi:hypothetical protein
MRMFLYYAYNDTPLLGEALWENVIAAEDSDRALEVIAEREEGPLFVKMFPLDPPPGGRGCFEMKHEEVVAAEIDEERTIRLLAPGEWN